MEVQSQEFENFLMRHNIHKAKELMRGIKDMKVLYKVPQKELNELLAAKELNPLWKMMSEIPFTVLKSKLCDARALSQIVVNSCNFKTELDQRDWLYLKWHLEANKKIFLNNISYTEKNYLRSEPKYEAKTQNLPWDYVELKSCKLITPLNLAIISGVSEKLNLCTRTNKDKIGPRHQKMMVFVKDKLTAVLTVYPSHNCYAVSGKNNSRIDSEVEDEIKELLLSVGLLNHKPHLIDNESDFFTVNHCERESFSVDSIESGLVSRESFFRAMFPDAENIILRKKEEEQKRREEARVKREAAIKEKKDELIATLSSQELVVKIQKNLIKQASEADSVYAIERLNHLIRHLSEDENKLPTHRDVFLDYS